MADDKQDKGPRSKRLKAIVEQARAVLRERGYTEEQIEAELNRIKRNYDEP